MGYLKTIITYNVPAEAEVDKAFLEAHGITVCLLNANTSRNELGAPFYIQLQVADEEYDRAAALIRETNPSRFGSEARVAEIDRVFKRGAVFFFLGAIAAGTLYFFITPAPEYKPDLPIYVRQPPDLRPWITALTAMLGGTLAVMLGKKKVLNQPPEPARSAPDST